MKNTWEKTSFKTWSRCVFLLLLGGHSRRWWEFTVLPGSLRLLWQWWWWHAGWFRDYWGAKKDDRSGEKSSPMITAKGCKGSCTLAKVLDFKDAMLMWLVNLKPFKIFIRCREHRSSSNPKCCHKKCQVEHQGQKKKASNWLVDHGRNFFTISDPKEGYTQPVFPTNICHQKTPIHTMKQLVSSGWDRGARAVVATIARWTAIEKRLVAWWHRVRLPWGRWVLVEEVEVGWGGCGFWWDWKVPQKTDINEATQMPL